MQLYDYEFMTKQGKPESQWDAGFARAREKFGDDGKPLTPWALVCEMFSKIPEKKGKCLIIGDFNLLHYAVNYGNFDEVWFVPVNSLMEGLAKFSGSMKEKVKVLPIDYNNLIESTKKELGDMKFDVIVGNPPYGSVHLPMLKICIDHLSDSGKSITIQPIRWLQDPLWKLKKSSDAKKYQRIFDGKIETIDVIFNREATKIFEGASMAMDLGIISINKAGGNFDYSSLCSIRDGVDLGSTLRILKKFSFMGKHAKNFDYTQSNFFPMVCIDAAGGGRGLGTVKELKQNYGIFANGKSKGCKYGDGLTPDEAFKANKRATRGSVKNWLAVSFDTEEECQNFFNYIKLPAFKFYVYAVTLDVHIQSDFLPMPEFEGAFKEEWTNEKFFEYFDLTSEERQIIEKVCKEIGIE